MPQMAQVERFAVKTGKSLWGGIDNAHPEAAYLIAAAGAVIDTQDQAYHDALAASPKCSYVGETPLPVAAFSGDDLSGAAPLSVVFTNTSTEATSYAWDFGDTGTSTEENPTHIYTDTGVYEVELVATGPGGNDTETKAAYVTVV